MDIEALSERLGKQSENYYLKSHSKDLTDFDFSDNEEIIIDGYKLPELISLKGLPRIINTLTINNIEINNIGIEIDFINRLKVDEFTGIITSFNGIKIINELEYESIFSELKDYKNIPKINKLYPISLKDIKNKDPRVLNFIRNNVFLIGIKTRDYYNSECNFVSGKDIDKIIEKYKTMNNTHGFIQKIKKNFLTNV